MQQQWWARIYLSGQHTDRRWRRDNWCQLQNRKGISSFPAHDINTVVTCDQYQHKDIWLFNATVLSVVTYASWTWKMTSRIVKKLDVFQQRCLRRILRPILLGPHHKRGDRTESWVKKTSWHSSWAEIQDGAPYLTSAWRETCKDSYDMDTVRREERKRTTRGDVEENILHGSSSCVWTSHGRN